MIIILENINSDRSINLYEIESFNRKLNTVLKSLEIPTSIPKEGTTIKWSPGIEAHLQTYNLTNNKACKIFKTVTHRMAEIYNFNIKSFELSDYEKRSLTNESQDIFKI